MYRFSSIYITFLLLVSKLAHGVPDCVQIQARIDSYGSLKVLKQRLPTAKPSFLKDLFLCLGNSTQPQRIPLDFLTNGRNFTYGDGWGTNRFYHHVGPLQWLKAVILNRIWMGKIIAREKDGRLTIRNMVSITLSMWFEGTVYNYPSIVDGFDAVIGDYRDDSTVPIFSKRKGRTARDELREIIYKGALSEIYLGRGFFFSGRKSDLKNNTIWQDPTKWDDAPFLIADFRSKAQSMIPWWAYRYYK